MVEREPRERVVAQDPLELRERAALQQQVADLRIPVLRLVALAEHVVRREHHAHRVETLVEVDRDREHALGRGLGGLRLAERHVFEGHEQQLVDGGAATDVDSVEEAQRELAVELLQRLVHEVERLEVGLHGVERLLHEAQRARRLLGAAFGEQRGGLEEARAIEQSRVAAVVASHACDRELEARAGSGEVRRLVREQSAQEVRLGRRVGRALACVRQQVQRDLAFVALRAWLELLQRMHAQHG